MNSGQQEKKSSQVKIIVLSRAMYMSTERSCNSVYIKKCDQIRSKHVYLASAIAYLRSINLYLNPLFGILVPSNDMTLILSYNFNHLNCIFNSNNSVPYKFS